MTKAALRELYLARRLALQQEDYIRLNDALLQEIKQLHWEAIDYVHCFWPITGKREVDTLRIIQWLQLDWPAIKIVLPQADFRTGTMLHRVYTSASVMHTNDYGITEPTTGELVEATQIDRILLPLLAFDRQGNRVGYGKGFYDKFLSECSDRTEFIGLSLFEPVDIIEDVTDTDIKLHRCVTPYHTYLF